MPRDKRALLSLTSTAPVELVPVVPLVWSGVVVVVLLVPVVWSGVFVVVPVVLPVAG